MYRLEFENIVQKFFSEKKTGMYHNTQTMWKLSIFYLKIRWLNSTLKVLSFERCSFSS